MRRTNPERPFQTRAEAATYAAARALDAANMALWESAIRQAVGARSMSLAVDVGCGTGHFLVAIREATRARVIGLDASIPMLLEARTAVGDAFPLVCANGSRLPIGSGLADFLFYSMVVHHLESVTEALLEGGRCLRKDGLICIRTSTVDRLECFAYLQYFPSAMERDRVKMPSVADLVRILDTGMFRVVRHDVVLQTAEDSVADYVQFVRSRSLSDLIAIADEEFANGCASLASDVEEGRNLDLREPMDFIVARRV